MAQKNCVVSVFMDNPKYDEISGYIYKDFPNACILYIDEIHNQYLLEKYEKKKKEIKADEKLLFHGTKEAYIQPIIEMGFDPSKNRTSAFGKGTYFATSANYSLHYTDTDKNGISYIFVSKVLVGKVCVGSSNKVIPDGFDNFVNVMKNPTIYVTPYHDGAYPQYIVAFHKNAPS